MLKGNGHNRNQEYTLKEAEQILLPDMNLADVMYISDAYDIGEEEQNNGKIFNEQDIVELKEIFVMNKNKLEPKCIKYFIDEKYILKKNPNIDVYSFMKAVDNMKQMEESKNNVKRFKELNSEYQENKNGKLQVYLLGTKNPTDEKEIRTDKLVKVTFIDGNIKSFKADEEDLKVYLNLQQVKFVEILDEYTTNRIEELQEPENKDIFVLYKNYIGEWNLEDNLFTRKDVLEVMQGLRKKKEISERDFIKLDNLYCIENDGNCEFFFISKRLKDCIGKDENIIDIIKRIQDIERLEDFVKANESSLMETQKELDAKLCEMRDKIQADKKTDSFIQKVFNNMNK